MSTKSITSFCNKVKTAFQEEFLSDSDIKNYKKKYETVKDKISENVEKSVERISDTVNELKDKVYQTKENNLTLDEALAKLAKAESNRVSNINKRYKGIIKRRERASDLLPSTKTKITKSIKEAEKKIIYLASTIQEKNETDLELAIDSINGDLTKADRIIKKHIV